MGLKPHPGGSRRRPGTTCIALLVWLLLVSVAAANVGVTATVVFAADDPFQYPDAMPPVGVSVASDGLDANGHWSQLLRLTIQRGGTLADASTIVYGDARH